MNEKLMAEGYKEMAEENLRLAKQFLEMVYAIKLPKLTRDEVAKAVRNKRPSSYYPSYIYPSDEALLKAQIDLIKEANKNIVWEE